MPPKAPSNERTQARDRSDRRRPHYVTGPVLGGGCRVDVCAAKPIEPDFLVARTHENGTSAATRMGCHRAPKAIPDRKGPVDCTQLPPTQLAFVRSWHNEADK